MIGFDFSVENVFSEIFDSIAMLAWSLTSVSFMDELSALRFFWLSIMGVACWDDIRSTCGLHWVCSRKPVHESLAVHRFLRSPWINASQPENLGDPAGMPKTSSRFSCSIQ